MTVAVDAVSTAAISTNVTGSYNATANITVGSGLSNGALTIGVMWDVAVTATSAHWDSAGTNQLMSSAGAGTNSTGGLRVELFTLVNPTAGNKNFNVTWTGGNADIQIFAVSWTGVNQTGGATSFAHVTTANNQSLASNGVLTLNITSATGDAVIAFFENDFTFASPTPCNQTQLYATNSAQAGGCANRAAGAASVSMTATNGATGDNACAVGCDIVAAATATTTVAWFQPPDIPTYGRKSRDFVAPSSFSFVAPPISVFANSAIPEPDTPVYGKPVRDSIAPAFIVPAAVTVGISGMSWFEPLDIPVYGKPSRDFVAPAFTEPTSVTVGISGMSWFEPFDIPTYSKPSRDFVAPAFTEPTTVTVGISGMAWFVREDVYKKKVVPIDDAVARAIQFTNQTVGISGMSWFEPLDIPVYGKPLRDNIASTFVAPFISSIQGNAWFEPLDIPIYGKPLRDSLAPSFVSQFVIAGISGNAWFVREDTYKRKPSPVDEAPPRALQFTNQTVTVSGMAWFTPPDFAKTRVVNYTPPPSWSPQVFTSYLWEFAIEDSVVLRDPLLTIPAIWDPKVQTDQTVGISGMSWFEPPDFAKSRVSNQTIPSSWNPKAFEVVNWGFTVSDTLILPDPLLRTQAAWDPKVQIDQVVGISGMAWFTPPDFAKTRIVNYTPPSSWNPKAFEVVNWGFTVSDTLVLPDPLLTVPTAWDPQIGPVPPVGISGMSWFIATDWAKSKTIYDTPPPALTPQVFSYLNWGFTVSDTIILPDPLLRTQAAWDPQFVFQIVIGPSGIPYHPPPDFAKTKIVNYTPPPGWAPQSFLSYAFEFIVSDIVTLHDYFTSTDPAWDPKFTFQQTVGISGMSWFTPPDFAKTRIVNYTPPPAWDPQFVFQTPVVDSRIVKFIGNVGHFMIR